MNKLTKFLGIIFTSSCLVACQNKAPNPSNNSFDDDSDYSLINPFHPHMKLDYEEGQDRVNDYNKFYKRTDSRPKTLTIKLETVTEYTEITDTLHYGANGIVKETFLQEYDFENYFYHRSIHTDDVGVIEHDEKWYFYEPSFLFEVNNIKFPRYQTSRDKREAFISEKDAAKGQQMYFDFIGLPRPDLDFGDLNMMRTMSSTYGLTCIAPSANEQYYARDDHEVSIYSEYYSSYMGKTINGNFYDPTYDNVTGFEQQKMNYSYTVKNIKTIDDSWNLEFRTVQEFKLKDSYGNAAMNVRKKSMYTVRPTIEKQMPKLTAEGYTLHDYRAEGATPSIEEVVRQHNL